MNLIAVSLYHLTCHVFYILNHRAVCTNSMQAFILAAVYVYCLFKSISPQI